MFKYLVLLQVLLAGELCCAKNVPPESYFRSVEYLGASVNNIRPVVPVQLFPQLLNHSDPANSIIWYQPVVFNSEHYRHGGPVFVMIGTGNVNYYQVLTSGAWIDYAKQFGALCVYIDHRYYGLSRTTNDTSTKNLEYLTTEQALADVELLIAEINIMHRLPKDVKWIAFGGGYAGSLAAWLRLKYPHLVHGAVASSAPLKSIPYFNGFYEGIEELLGNHSKECVSGVKDAFTELDKLLQDRSGQKEAGKMFHYCGKLHQFSSNDVAFFREKLATALARIVLQNNSTLSTIRSTCDVMTNQTVGTPLRRLAHLLEQENAPHYCVVAEYFADIYNPLLVDWDHFSVLSGERQRLYQLCTERGLFQVSSSLFGSTSFDRSYFLEKCVSTFGPKYNERLLYEGVRNTQLTYGGLNINVTNVAFVQGSADPWNSLGIMHNISSQSPAIVIQGAFHCSDMAPASPHDTPELKAARAEIAQNIGTWLKK